MYQRIFVPVDGSATSALGLKEACQLARLTHASLRLIHVIDELSFAMALQPGGHDAGPLLDMLRQNGTEILQTALATAREQEIKADSVLYESLDKTVAQRVLAEAEEWKADLIVIGTHGRRGVRRLMLGSSAEEVLRSAAIPVLLVHGPQGAP